jgi:hypothetical protein
MYFLEITVWSLIFFYWNATNKYVETDKDCLEVNYLSLNLGDPNSVGGQNTIGRKLVYQRISKCFFDCIRLHY